MSENYRIIYDSKVAASPISHVKKVTTQESCILGGPCPIKRLPYWGDFFPSNCFLLIELQLRKRFCESCDFLNFFLSFLSFLSCVSFLASLEKGMFQFRRNSHIIIWDHSLLQIYLSSMYCQSIYLSICLSPYLLLIPFLGRILIKVDIKLFLHFWK